MKPNLCNYLCKPTERMPMNDKEIDALYEELGGEG